MAENFEYTPGTGGVGAADDIAAVKYPFVKLTDGLADSTTAIYADEGGVANALRVCPASDIADGTYLGDIKFGESLPAGTNEIGKLAAGTAGIGKLTANTGVDIGDVDVISILPGTAAANLGKVEDAGHTTGDVGVMMLGVRNDSDTVLAGADLDYIPIACDLHGHIIVEASEEGQSAADYAHGLMPICGVVLDALPATDTIAGNGEWGVFQMTQYGEMRVKDESANTLLGTIDSDTNAIKDAVEIMDDWDDANQCKVIIQTGANAIGTLAANSGIDIGDVDVTSIVPLTGATNLGKTRDLVCGADDVGVMALAVRDDTLTGLTPADGDYVPLRVSSTGQLHVTGGGGGTQYNMDVALGDADTTTLAGVVRDDSLSSLAAEDGDITVLRVSSTGALHVTGGGGGTEYTEDEATPAPIVGTATMMERDDIITTLTPVAVDWAAMRCSEEGALWTQDFNSDAILTALESLDDAVDGNYLNVNLNLAGTDAAAGESALDGTELRVTIATDDDGVLSLGVIEGWDATHASAASADGPQIMGAGYSAGLPTDVGADGDAARICTDRHGRIVRGLMPQWFNEVFDSANASAEANVIKAGTPSRKIYILSLTISVDTEMWVKLQDEDSNPITCKHWFKAGGGKTITYPPEAPLVLDVVDKDLEVITEGAGDIGVEITGYLAI